ncbi:hypothetical protein H8S77_14365 [Parabacteroides sp. BX2]|jgi:hypothetical protein|uniref:Uncharacterized protein n=1 Tax=Parabacteroides segnis TaxID=2763058 RepID=A0ABR7E4Q1_9BACT|nr:MULTISPECIES: hypothetical protein [Parabacteroides]MBC5644064.1 hypothetical protein [Parabacteroides segnis]MCM0714232.1 hypothetical protein [Parabacteroides sp. TA-V-105]
MTQEEFDSLVQRVTNALQGSSKMVTDLRVVKSSVGVNLLPGILSGELVALEAASLMGTDGKTPLFEVGSISSGLDADASIVLSGTDPSGNPIYKIGLVLPKGDDGAIPFLEFGSISTGEPDTDASATFKENGTTEDGRPKYKLFLTIPRGSKGNKGNDGKTPVMETGSASKGQEPSVSIIRNGDDPSGNPKYKIDLVLPQGDAGKNPVLELGEVMTGEPGSEASAVFIPVGQTPEGNPKYSLKLTIPRGDTGLPGKGSGNVSVNGSDLIRGKQYLFVPSSDGSTEGSFVEYIPFNDAELREEIGRNLQLAKTYTNEQIAGIVQFDIKVVLVLPDTGVKGTIYLVPKTGSGNDVHNEYIWNETSGKFELIGSTSVDLSDYYTKNEANGRYVLRETGKRLITDAEGTKLDGIEAGANKYVLPAGEGYNFIPAGGAVGQVLTNTAPGVAEWGNSNSEYIEIGDVTQINRVRTTSELDWGSFINGNTIEDMERAYQENIPIYSRSEGPYHSYKKGYSRCTSIMQRYDGEVVHYLLSFVISEGVTNSDNIYHYLLDLRGVTGDGWRDATVRAACTYAKTVITSGENIPFTGGYVVFDMSISKNLLIVPAGFYPLHNSVTTLLIRNTSSSTTKITFTIKLNANAGSEGSKLLIVSELPELAGKEACELSILWADWKYTVRASEPFIYNEYVE